MFPNIEIPYSLIKDILLLSYAIFSGVFFLGRFTSKMNDLLSNHLSILSEINRNLTGINEQLRGWTIKHEDRRTEHTVRAN